MKDCKISDDGKVHGTAEEVLAYEAGLANPLSGMRFPYVTKPHDYSAGTVCAWLAGDGAKIPANDEERVALVAFANLAPLIGAEIEWYMNRCHDRAMWQAESRVLADAYDAACKLIPK